MSASTLTELRRRLADMQEDLFSPSTQRERPRFASTDSKSTDVMVSDESHDEPRNAQHTPTRMSPQTNAVVSIDTRAGPAPVTPLRSHSVLSSASEAPSAVRSSVWGLSSAGQATALKFSDTSDHNLERELADLTRRLAASQVQTQEARSATLQMQQLVVDSERDLDSLRAELNAERDRANSLALELSAARAAVEGRVDQSYVTELCAIVDQVNERGQQQQHELDRVQRLLAAAEVDRDKAVARAAAAEASRDMARVETSSLRERHAQMITEHQQRVLLLDTRYRELYAATRSLKEDVAIDAAIHVKIERFLRNFDAPEGMKKEARPTTAGTPQIHLEPPTSPPTPDDGAELLSLRHHVAVLMAQLRANNIAVREFATTMRNRGHDALALSPPSFQMDSHFSASAAMERSPSARGHAAFPQGAPLVSPRETSMAESPSTSPVGGARVSATAPRYSQSSPMMGALLGPTADRHSTFAGAPTYLPPGFVVEAVHHLDPVFDTNREADVSVSAAAAKPTSRTTHIQPASPSHLLSEASPYTWYARGITTSALSVHRHGPTLGAGWFSGTPSNRSVSSRSTEL
jgi:hypothetical protein